MPVCDQRPVWSGYAGHPVPGCGRAAVPACAGIWIFQSPGGGQYRGGSHFAGSSVFRPGDAVRHADGPYRHAAGAVPAVEFPGGSSGDHGGIPEPDVPDGHTAPVDAAAVSDAAPANL